jgi:large conductance mechanosensitive channel
MLKEFREFALKGNMLDLAIAVVLGGAFGKVIETLVANVFMPLVGAIVGKVDLSQLAWSPLEGVNVSYGMFLNAIINFIIVGFALFMVVKAMNQLKRKQEAAPAEPSDEVKLLTEIRDSLRKP